MNPFDAAVVALVVAALVIGFNSGLLRSLATILAYVSALPIAVAATPPGSNDADRKRDDPDVYLAESFLLGLLVGSHILFDGLRILEVKNNAHQLILESLQFVGPDSAARRWFDRQSAKVLHQLEPGRFEHCPRFQIGLGQFRRQKI